MNRKVSFSIGLALIMMGGAWLALGILGLTFGLRVWQLWPLSVIVAGWAFVLPPLLIRRRRNLGALFIPGFPILATGGLLMLASLFSAWGIWGRLWPVEVIALGAGFLSAALYMRKPGLLVPGIILGMNGVLFQFCAWSGWWSIWAIAWLVEPLSVGLSLLALNVFRPARGLVRAGVLLSGLSLAGLVLAGAISLLGFLLPFSWLLSFFLPASLILVGLWLLGRGLGRPVAVKGFSVSDHQA